MVAKSTLVRESSSFGTPLQLALPDLSLGASEPVLVSAFVFVLLSAESTRNFEFIQLSHHKEIYFCT